MAPSSRPAKPPTFALRRDEQRARAKRKAGVTAKLWEVSDLVALLEATESKKSGLGAMPSGIDS